MTWLTPLGFLGFIGIIVLIIIYILKPNYQQKFISSTYIWELSLKYKRKKIPISKFRNILIFICQVLILSLCAMILAQPIIRENQPPAIVEKVAIIDASANMRTAYDQESRFERAVFEAEMLAEEVFEQEGYFTLIIAGTEASYHVQRITKEDAFDFSSGLQDLIQDENGDMVCSYGTGDIEGAIDLAQKIVDQNASTEVYLYTANEYLDDGGAVNVVDVSQNGEWNAAILNCEAIFDENYYTFKASVASYNRDADLMVFFEVKGVNGTGSTVTNPPIPVRCNDNQIKTVSFISQNTSTPIFEFESVRAYLIEADSFVEDNDYYIYGGKKPVLNVQYYNPHANIFFGGALMTARATLTNWDMNLKEINKGVESKDIPVTGYDFYVFENSMPDVLPTDGVVMLVNMDKTPEGLTMIQSTEVNGDFTLTFGEAHPLTNRLNPENIQVTKYNKVLQYEGFKPLLYCAGDPVLLVKETAEQKIIVMNFSVAFSMVSMYKEFPALFYNIFTYFMPATLTDHAFDINETISLNARGEELLVESSNANYKEKFTELPTDIVLSKPGSYTLTQTPLSGIPVVEQFFVKIPASESNISQTYDSLYELIVPQKEITDDLDLLLYFAAALVAFVFFERLLQGMNM